MAVRTLGCIDKLFHPTSAGVMSRTRDATMSVACSTTSRSHPPISTVPPLSRAFNPFAIARAAPCIPAAHPTIAAAMIELRLSSEVSNLLNFIFLDLFVLSYIMHVSGRLAGHVNHSTLRNNNQLHLVVFSAPLVGGGMIMSRGWSRRLIIFIRVSTILAVAICNFGLEGRSRPATKTLNVAIRIPGELRNPVINLIKVTTVRRHCGDPGFGRNMEFRVVANGRCEQTLRSPVYIRQMSLDTQEMNNLSATHCVSESPCESYSTKFRCKDGDIVCTGALPMTCPKEFPLINYHTCSAVMYERSVDYAWMCDYGSIVPGFRPPQKAQCRGIAARRKDIEGWVHHYPNLTSKVEEALFAAAYGAEAKANVTLPAGSESVTVVSLWWLLPTAWTLAVGIGLTVWSIVMLVVGSKVIVHDERGLAKLLDKQIECRLGTDESDESAIASIDC